MRPRVALKQSWPHDSTVSLGRHSWLHSTKCRSRKRAPDGVPQPSYLLGGRLSTQADKTVCEKVVCNGVLRASLSSLLESSPTSHAVPLRFSCDLLLKWLISCVSLWTLHTHPQMRRAPRSSPKVVSLRGRVLFSTASQFPSVLPSGFPLTAMDHSRTHPLNVGIRSSLSARRERRSAAP